MKPLFNLCILFFFHFASLAQGLQDAKGYFLELIDTADVLIYDEPSASLQISNDALRIALELGDDSLKAVALNRIAAAHWSFGNSANALEYLQQSIELCKFNKYDLLLARNYSNFGNLYSSADLYFDAISYYKRELFVQKGVGDQFRLFVVNNNIGRSFQQIGIYDSAMHYFENAKNYLDSSYVALFSVFYFNVAETLFKQGDLSGSDSIISKALDNARLFGSKRGLIRNHQLLAEVELLKGKPDQAFQSASYALKLAEESKKKELLHLCHKTLSKCYVALGNFEKAHWHQNLHENYLDSVQSISSVNELELLAYYQRLFNFRILEEKNIINEQLADQRKTIIYLLVALLVIAVVFLFIIIASAKKIRSQAKALESLNGFKNKIFAVVSHDLRSPIQAVSEALTLFQERIVTQEDLEKHVPGMKKNAERLNELLNNVLQWAQGQLQHETLEKQKFLLMPVLNDLEEELSDRSNEKGIKLSFDVAEDYQLFSNSGIVRVVLRNLITNAIKYSFKGSQVVIHAFAGQNRHLIEVIDHGVGIKNELLGGVFTMESGSSLGTDGEKGNGLGLALCYDFMRRLGGDIKVESERGKGSTFRLSFPITADPQS